MNTRILEAPQTCQITKSSDELVSPSITAMSAHHNLMAVNIDLLPDSTACLLSSFHEGAIPHDKLLSTLSTLRSQMSRTPEFQRQLSLRLSEIELSEGTSSDTYIKNVYESVIATFAHTSSRPLLTATDPALFDLLERLIQQQGDPEHLSLPVHRVNFERDLAAIVNRKDLTPSAQIHSIVELVDNLEPKNQPDRILRVLVELDKFTTGPKKIGLTATKAIVKIWTENKTLIDSPEIDVLIANAYTTVGKSGAAINLLNSTLERPDRLTKEQLGMTTKALGSAYLFNNISSTPKHFSDSFKLDPTVETAALAALNYFVNADVNTAKHFAELTEITFLRDVGRVNHATPREDINALGNLLIAKIVKCDPSGINEAMARIQCQIPNRKDIDQILKKISIIKSFISSKDNQEQYQDMASLITKVEDGLNEHLKLTLEAVGNQTLVIADRRKDLAHRADRLDIALDNSSYTYRNALGRNKLFETFGNFSRGDQMPDHAVGNGDIVQFERLLKAPLAALLTEDGLAQIQKRIHGLDTATTTLADITDIDQVSFIMDRIIRGKFGTDNKELEKLHGTRHKDHDARMLGLKKVTGFSDSQLIIKDNNYPFPHSRTNIAATFELGEGDCRPHAQVKQIMFDLWQKNKIDLCLRSASNALSVNDIEEFQKALATARELMLFEMRSVDVYLRGQVANDHGYGLWDSQHDAYVYDQDSTNQRIESHTMNLLVRRDSSGIISGVSLADSFYQQQFPLGEGHIQRSQISIIDNGKDSTTDGVSIQFSIGNIRTFDPLSSEYVNTPIKVEPSVYRRAIRDVYDDFGRVKFFGFPTEVDLLYSFSHSGRTRAEQILEKAMGFSNIN